MEERQRGGERKKQKEIHIWAINIFTDITPV